MPATRKSTRSSSAGAGKQSTLSFKHKVTKSIRTGKGGYKSPSRAKEYVPEPSPEADDDSKAKHKPKQQPKPKPKQQQQKQPEEEAAAISGSSNENTDAEDVDVDVRVRVPAGRGKLAPKPAVVVQESAAEREATRVSDAAIERYWAGIEAGRTAKAVHRKHTEGLTTGEKVLRYFDVSSQYGVGFPSISPPAPVPGLDLRESACD